MQSDVKVEQRHREASYALTRLGAINGSGGITQAAEAFARFEASLRQPAPDALVERVARAMQAVSRPDVDPDKLTPGPRGSVGLMPVWALYEHMAKAALSAIAPDLTAARIDPATIAGEG